MCSQKSFGAACGLALAIVGSADANRAVSETQALLSQTSRQSSMTKLDDSDDCENYAWTENGIDTLQEMGFMSKFGDPLAGSVLTGGHKELINSGTGARKALEMNYMTCVDITDTALAEINVGDDADDCAAYIWTEHGIETLQKKGFLGKFGNPLAGSLLITEHKELIRSSTGARQSLKMGYLACAETTDVALAESRIHDEATTRATTNPACCSNFDCPLGHKSLPTFGDTLEECCMSTCHKYYCPHGYLPKDNMSKIVGVGRDEDTCCEETCADDVCPIGHRNIGKITLLNPRLSPNKFGCCESCDTVHCKLCSEDRSQCEECKRGSRLDKITGTCQACSQTGCANCDADIEICEECDLGHHWDTSEGTCATCSASGCKTCTSDLTTCDSCESGFRLHSDGHCEACEASDCLTCCGNPEECDSCNPSGPFLPGYFLNSSGGACTKCAVPGCKMCSLSPSICEWCGKGHGLGRNGNCRTCRAAGCSRCDASLDVCDGCAIDYDWDENKESCLPRKCQGMTCKSCSEDVTKCDSCHDGYQLDWFKGTCEACTAQNCNSCNRDLSKCDSCPHGFLGDRAQGICNAIKPTPYQGQCEGLE